MKQVSKQNQKNTRRRKNKSIPSDQMRCNYCENRPFIHLNSMEKHLKKKHPKIYGETKNDSVNSNNVAVADKISESETMCEKNTKQAQFSLQSKQCDTKIALTVETDIDGFGELVFSFF